MIGATEIARRLQYVAKGHEETSIAEKKGRLAAASRIGPHN
jgi:hypothetical protein